MNDQPEKLREQMSMIAEMVARHRYVYATEKDLQAAIEQVFTRNSLPFNREHELGEAGTIDFLLGAIGLEVKIAGSPASVLEQLIRYAKRPEVEAILLVTTKSSVGRRIPPSLMGKPCLVVALWSNGL
jgi:alkanesulfonate monooxygenase SsuD/methylene tetrahydromethanopterin reductase-like flavin-dependent oxidoreductase (luciferase family)